MFCTKCGKEIDNSKAFCTHCGAEIKKTVKSVENEVLALDEPIETATEPIVKDWYEIFSRNA